MNELALKEEPQSIMAIIAKAAQDPSIDVDKMERLLGVMERMETRDAEKQFNAAFVKLQSELPTIVASSEIPNRGKYERFEDVMRQISPMLTANGFCVSFSQSTEGNRIVATCHLRHIGGHSHPNSFGVRVGGKADSETQADCKASTTAKRNALLQALNIVIRQDCLTDEEHDASIEGGTITEEQAKDLELRVAATNSDQKAFLDFAGAKTFAEIRTGKYHELDKILKRKERANG